MQSKDKLGLMLILVLLILPGCQAKNYQSPNIAFTEQGGNWQLDATNETYETFKTELAELNPDAKADLTVGVLSSSTANVAEALGLNIVAAPESKYLDESLQAKMDNGDVTSIGSAISPNLETIAKVNPDILLVASTMPHQDTYQNFDNVISVPQDYYSDINSNLIKIQISFKSNHSYYF